MTKGRILPMEKAKKPNKGSRFVEILYSFAFCIIVPFFIGIGIVLLDSIKKPANIGIAEVFSFICSILPSLVLFLIAMFAIRSIGELENRYRKKLETELKDKYQSRSKLEDIEFEIQHTVRVSKTINGLPQIIITPISILCSAIIIPICLSYIDEMDKDKKVLVETLIIVFRYGGLLILAAFALILSMIILIGYYISAMSETKLFCLEKRKQEIEKRNQDIEEFGDSLKNESKGELHAPIG